MEVFSNQHDRCKPDTVLVRPRRDWRVKAVEHIVIGGEDSSLLDSSQAFLQMEKYVAPVHRSLFNVYSSLVAEHT